jgi:hypothetical protein
VSNSFVQLPYTATTSGQLLDSELIGSLERERVQIGGATLGAIAPVTSSAGLLVNLSTVSYVVTLSSNPVASQVVSLSSGTVTLSSNPTVAISSGIVTLSSNPTVNVSSGVVTLSSNPTVNVSSGVVTLSSAIAVSSGQFNVVGSSGAIAQVTSSGGMWVQLTNGSAGGGSTAVNIVGAGSFAPVTTSDGLLTMTAAVLLDTIVSTIGAPISQSFTTLPAVWYNLTIVSTQATSHAVKVFTATTLTSNASTFFQVQIPAAVNAYNFPFHPGGVAATGGLHVTVTVNSTSTSAATTGYYLIAQYRI